MTRQDRSDTVLQERLGYQFSDPALLDQALTHVSAVNVSASDGIHYQRLEFLGDSVLGLVVTEELYTKYPELDESRLSPLRSGIVNMRALADIARTLDLGRYMRIGKGEEVTGGRDKNSLLADALEALLGALYLEHGFLYRRADARVHCCVFQWRTGE